MSNITIPPVLAFERKLEPSDALMFSGNWQDVNKEKTDWLPIALFERRNRAVKSNFKPEVLADEEKLQEAITESNISWGDDAALNHEHDTLKLSFTMRVLSGFDKPSACSKPEFESLLKDKIDQYRQDNNQTLAKRYAYNIANGRFLWRNRIDALQVQIVVNSNVLTEPLTFNAYDYSLRKTEAQDDNQVSQLAELIHQGLADKQSTILTIDAYVQLGKGQRVWPSQEFVNTKEMPKGSKSRYLFSLDGIAAVHSEKIGNAIRTIDDWYPEFDPEISSPIAIESYGSVTQRGKAYRSSKVDFPTLIRKWVSNETLAEQEQHFVIAMLIRGGVFGEKDKD